MYVKNTATYVSCTCLPTLPPHEVLLIWRGVERDLEAERAGSGHGRVEVVDGAQLRVHRRVPAPGGTDRPGAAGVVGAGIEGVARALAVGAADRVDRGQVDDVEPEVGHVVEVLRGPVEASEGPGEQLVPGSHRGATAIDPDPLPGRLGQASVGEIGRAHV